MGNLDQFQTENRRVKQQRRRHAGRSELESFDRKTKQTQPAIKQSLRNKRYETTIHRTMVNRGTFARDNFKRPGQNTILLHDRNNL